MIGIIGAMDEEVEQIVLKMGQTKRKTVLRLSLRMYVFVIPVQNRM